MHAFASVWFSQFVFVCDSEGHQILRAVNDAFSVRSDKIHVWTPTRMISETAQVPALMLIESVCVLLQQSWIVTVTILPW